MTITEYFLLSLLYFWASSTSLSLGVGYYTVYRPVLSGLLAGIAVGDPFTGMVSGGVVNIIYIDFVSTGGSFKGDQCLTAIIAALISVMLKLSPLEAAAAAYPFGFLGILIWKYRLNINSLFVKAYESKHENGKKPSISLYDGVYPQLTLYVMSTAVILSAVSSMFLLKSVLVSFRGALFIAGLFLVYMSVCNVLVKIGGKRGILLFAASFMLTLETDPDSNILFGVLMMITFVIANKDLYFNRIDSSKDGIIGKKDLVYSWFIWMNYSHSCYSYDRLQGMAFAHSMKNIFRKLYGNTEAAHDAIHRHSEFFNTEPNMGTPIHGYIISMEEQHVQDNDTAGIMFMKKGMMGIAAGLGDSYTQVVLTPLYLSMSIMLCMDGSFYMALIPMLMLTFTILTLSYNGFMKGYYDGKESLIERIDIVKKSRLKIYFPYIFAGILGVSVGKLLMHDSVMKDLTIHAAVGIISIVLAALKKRRSLKFQ